MSRRLSARQRRRTTTSVVLSRLCDRAEYSKDQDSQEGPAGNPPGGAFSRLTDPQSVLMLSRMSSLDARRAGQSAATRPTSPASSRKSSSSP